MPQTQSMETVVCPACDKPVERHCANCGWLVCAICRVTFGKNNYFKVEDAKVKKRQNGL